MVGSCTDLNGLKDEAEVAKDAEALSVSDIVFAPSDTSAAVTTGFTLPASGRSDTVITWTSSNTAVITISDDGSATVTRPSGSDVTVTLTATITKSSESTIKTFTVTVLAAATVTHSVTFNANGGSGTMTAQVIAEGASANLTTNAFTRTGYTFAGWATTSGGEVVYADGQSYTMDGADADLYAVWTAITHTVTFNANGGSGTMTAQVIAEGASANLTANAFTNIGYIFAGWSTTSGGALAYADRQEYAMGASDATLYAKWTASASLLIKLTFDDQSCADTSGNNNTCTGTSVSYASDDNGGYAASLNGSSSYIKLPNSILSRDTFTVMMRFKAEDGQKGCLLGYQNTTVGVQPTQFIPIIMVQSDGLLRGILWTTANDITVLSTTTVDDGNWHTVYFSAKSNSIALYLDGKQIGTATGTVRPLSMIYSQIGTSYGRARDPGYSTDAWYYFDGLVDNFYLYNAALH